MPSPLEFIQSLTQKRQPAKTMGAEKSGNDTETIEGSESAFSNVLNQAIQQQPEAKAAGNAKANKTLAPNLTEQTPPSTSEEDATTPDATELALLQAQLITPEQPIQPMLPEQQTGLLVHLSQLAVQDPLQPEAAPQAKQTMANEKNTPTATTTAVTPDSAKPISWPGENTEQSGSLSEATTPPDSVEMAQSFGLSTLSPEALGLMGMPVEFQIRQAIQQAPIVPAEAPTQPSLGIESLNTQAVATPAASIAVQQAINPTPENPSFDQALLDATQPVPANANTVPSTLEAAPDILKTEQPAPTTEAISTAGSELSHNANAFAEVLPEAQSSIQLDVQPQKKPVQPVTTSSSAHPEESEAGFESLLQPVTPNSAQQTNSQPANTTTPSPSEDINPLTSLQEQLSALNGEVETLPSPEESNGFQRAGSEADRGQATTEATEALPQTVSFDAPSNLAPNTPTTVADKLPQILSNAADPADQVVDGTVYSVKNGHKELILKLNPDNLGEVRINLISHGNNEMSARLIASNPESHALLKNQAESLKASLEAQGIQIDRLSVVLAGQTESSSNTSQQDHPQPFEQNRNQNTGHNQQQSFQQPEQNPNLFFQNGGQFQHKQGFAQNPGVNRYNQSGDAGGMTETQTGTEASNRRNDQGNLSLLA